jgi:hypothetical protein
MKITKLFTIVTLLSVILLTGCKKDKSKDNPTPTTSTTPTVTSTTPSDNASGIARNISISAVFSETMNVSTLTTSTFTVKQGVTNVAGSIAYSGTTATFIPTLSLLADSTYTVRITTDVKSAAGISLVSDKVWSFKTGIVSNVAAVNLGSAANYVILAKTAITNLSTSNITGDLGLSPAATSYITGFSPTAATGYATSAQVTGKIYAADMAPPTPINLTTAVGDMITAYNDAAGRVSPDFSELATGNLGGKTLVPGLYKWTNSVTMPSNVVLSGGVNDVWIFQISGNMTMSSGVNISLIGGAQAKNVFWQVAGQVTLGTTTHMEGNILCMTGITLQTNATMVGRTLAQTAVVLDANAVTKP